MAHFKYQDKNGVEKSNPRPQLRALFKTPQIKPDKPQAPGGEIYQSLILEAKLEFNEWLERMEDSNPGQRSARSRKNGRNTQSKARKAKNS